MVKTKSTRGFEPTTPDGIVCRLDHSATIATRLGPRCRYIKAEEDIPHNLNRPNDDVLLSLSYQRHTRVHLSSHIRRTFLEGAAIRQDNSFMGLLGPAFHFLARIK